MWDVQSYTTSCRVLVQLRLNKVVLHLSFLLRFNTFVAELGMQMLQRNLYYGT